VTYGRAEDIAIPRIRRPGAGRGHLRRYRRRTSAQPAVFHFLAATFIADTEFYISIEWYIDLSFIVSLRSQRDIVFKERLDVRTPQTAHEQHALS